MPVFKVLLIEDNQDLRESVAEYLVMAGFTVTAVGTAAEFYQTVVTETWNVVVVDIGLPDQSGFVLVEYLRANTDLKVIVLTACDGLEDRIRGYDSGADIYMVKPVDCRELAAAITSLSQRHNMRQDSSADAPADADWWLDQHGWNLVSPKGDRVSLTGREVIFMQLLSKDGGQTTVQRNTLLSCIYQRDDEYASRSLDSLVRRLRIKIDAVWSEDNPIKTVHAVGYCFSAPLRL